MGYIAPFSQGMAWLIIADIDPRPTAGPIPQALPRVDSLSARNLGEDFYTLSVNRRTDTLRPCAQSLNAAGIKRRKAVATHSAKNSGAETGLLAAPET